MKFGKGHDLHFRYTNLTITIFTRINLLLLPIAPTFVGVVIATAHDPCCGHRHGMHPHTAIDVIQGSRLDRQPDAQHADRPAPAATRSAALRDGLPGTSQTAGLPGRIGDNRGGHFAADQAYVAWQMIPN